MVLLASSVAFAAMSVLTDPVGLILPAGASAEEVASVRASLGLDDPILVQYGRFMLGAVTGDFGTSLWLNRPALGAALERLPATALLVVTATVLGALAGLLTGVVAYLRRGSYLDRAINLISYSAISTAEFWIAMMLILLFSVQAGWLPTGGFNSARSLILPVVVLALRPFAHAAQMTRSTLLAESGKDYVLTARMKGLPEWSVTRRHLLRNASPPVITLAIYGLAQMFVGSAATVEIVFAWPGLGRLAVNALNRGDIYLIQAIVVVGACVVGGLNLVADMLVYAVDPRSRDSVEAHR